MTAPVYVYEAKCVVNEDLTLFATDFAPSKARIFAYVKGQPGPVFTFLELYKVLFGEMARELVLAEQHLNTATCNRLRQWLMHLQDVGYQYFLSEGSES